MHAVLIVKHVVPNLFIHFFCRKNESLNSAFHFSLPAPPAPAAACSSPCWLPCSNVHRQCYAQKDALEPSSSCFAHPSSIAVAAKYAVPIVGGAVSRMELLLWRPRTFCLFLWYYQGVFKLTSDLSNNIFFPAAGDSSGQHRLFQPTFLSFTYFHNAGLYSVKLSTFGSLPIWDDRSLFLGVDLKFQAKCWIP